MIVNLKMVFRDLAVLLIQRFVIFKCSCFFEVSIFSCLGGTNVIFIQVLPQDLLKKYLTYSKLYVFPKLGELDAKKLETVYANLRRESMVNFSFY